MERKVLSEEANRSDVRAFNSDYGINVILPKEDEIKDGIPPYFQKVPNLKEKEESDAENGVFAVQEKISKYEENTQ